MHSAVVVAAKFCELAEEEARKSGKPSDLVALKLLKLVYIAHGLKLARTSKPLISAPVEAWNHGPVIPELYQRIRREYGKGAIISKFSELADEDLRSISCSDLDIITETFDTYNKYTATELSKISHDPASPWYKIYSNLNRVDSIVIKDEDTREHYKDLLDRVERLRDRGAVYA